MTRISPILSEEQPTQSLLNGETLRSHENLRVASEIVDGFHRWTLASHDAAVRDASDGMCPVVRTQPKTAADAKAATVRHNRARGQHGILRMGEIVRSMRADGMSDDDICAKLGMEDEELERLADERPSPERVGKDSFGRGWVPVREDK